LSSFDILLIWKNLYKHHDELECWTLAILWAFVLSFLVWTLDIFNWKLPKYLSYNWENFLLSRISFGVKLPAANITFSLIGWALATTYNAQFNWSPHIRVADQNEDSLGISRTLERKNSDRERTGTDLWNQSTATVETCFFPA